MCGATAKRLFAAASAFIDGLLDTLDYRLDQTAPFNTAQSLSNIAVSSLNITPGMPPPAGRQDFAKQRAAGHRHAHCARVEPAHRAAGRAAHLAHSRLRGLAQLSPDSFRRHERAGADAIPPTASSTIRPARRSNPTSPTPLRGCRRAWASTTRSGRCAPLVREADSSSAATTPERRISTTARRGTPASAAIRRPSSRFPCNPKLDWGPAATDVRHVGLDQRQLRASLRARPSLPCARSGPARILRRRLDGKRHHQRADRLPLLAAARLQPHRQR